LEGEANVRVALQISLALWIMIGCAIAEAQRILEALNNKHPYPDGLFDTVDLTLESGSHGPTIIVADPRYAVKDIPPK
jgi:hypothetical protein